MHFIEVKQVNKSFRVGREEVKVLKDINLKIDKGEFLSIMGPSGGGKSTLLYLMGGLDQPTSGSIHLEGIDIGESSEKEISKLRRSKIGFVFQFYNLVPNLSVEDNIMLPILLDGKKPAQYKQKLDELLDFIKMEDKRKMTPRELSGGQQQRVAIARALLFDPDVLFLDEPIGNLDSKTGTEVMELFRQINTEYDKTIIQVTHSEESALYGTTICRLRDGELGKETVS